MGVFVASDLELPPYEGLMSLNDQCKRPPLATIRWQGTMTGSGLRRMDCPAARAAAGDPASAANCV